MEKENKDETKIENTQPIICSNSKCDKPVDKLRCPHCKKYGIVQNSYFCSKECFTGSWSEHKKLHADCKLDFSNNNINLE